MDYQERTPNQERQQAGEGIRRREGTDTIDRYATVLNLPKFKIDMDKIPLRLSDLHLYGDDGGRG